MFGLRPRWRKVLRDLWSSKTRTALVVLLIAVGVFAIGAVAGSRQMIATSIDAGYQASNPASATRGDIVAMYLVTVLLYGALSLFVVLPFGALGARLFADFNAGLFNFDVLS
jgi:nitrate reductase NapE component